MFFRKQQDEIPQFITVSLTSQSETSDTEDNETSYNLDGLIECLEHSENFTIENLKWMYQEAKASSKHVLCEVLKRKAFQAATFLIEECHISKGELSKALLDLCCYGEQTTKLARMLICHGASPNIKDSQGRTALHVCYASSTSSEFMSLIAKHSNLNLCDAQDDTVLHKAIRVHDDRTVAMLLKLGADPNQLDGQGQLPLVVASHTTQGGKCLSLLLQYGAKVDACDGQGHTALALVENPVASMILMEHGARSDSPDSQGVTPLHTAFSMWCRWRRGQSLALILFHEKNLADLLVRQSKSINLVDSHGRTPLHYACEALHNPAAQFAKALVEKGANLEAQDRNGWTPLHVAVAFGNSETAETLVRLGAKIDVKDHHGRTPVQLLGLESLARRQLPKEDLSHSVRVIAFGADAPSPHFVAPLSEISASEINSLDISSSHSIASNDSELASLFAYHGFDVHAIKHTSKSDLPFAAGINWQSLTA